MNQGSEDFTQSGPKPQLHSPVELQLAVWIEKTIVEDRPDRQDGPDRLGASLWSPQKNASNRDIYANMRDVKTGDLVLHFTDNEAITGISAVAAPADESFTGVPRTAWADQPCYRVPLQGFQKLNPPLKREWLFADPEVSEKLLAVLEQPRGRGLFYNSKLELNQGAYLTLAQPSLVEALDAAYFKNTDQHLPGLPTELQAAAEAEDDLGGAPPQPPATARRAWVYAPGPKAAFWDEFYQDSLMAIGWDDLGDLRQMRTLQATKEALEHTYGTEKGQGQNAKMCFDFAHSMQAGDIIYVKRGLHTFVGKGIVDGDYRFDPTRTTYQNVRKVRWTAKGSWPWNGQLPMKALTEWTGVSALKVVDSLVTEAPSASGTEASQPAPAQTERQPFSVEDALAGLFMSREEFEDCVARWREKKNLVLQGAPGVGKTFVARRLAYALMGYKDLGRVHNVQFHQSYGYEDFVQGYRPTGQGFALKDGVFLNFCVRALADKDETYVFIIDEINRGNLSKILGELMLLIEEDKRSSEWAVKLAYAQTAEERFYVPPNVYILGMMNTADRSLAVVDYALRRRFSFATVTPSFGQASFREHLLDHGVEEEIATRLIQRMTELNKEIANDTTNLGRGYCIGHSFFTPTTNAPRGEAWYKAIIQSEIAPLLEEYWFDQHEKVKQWRERLLA